jgi:hypothetical protein
MISEWGQPRWDEPVSLGQMDVIDRKVFIVKATGNVYLATDDEPTDEELARDYCFPRCNQRVQGWFRTDADAIAYLRSQGVRPRKTATPVHAPTFELYPA